jgi:hypothetical protein
MTADERATLVKVERLLAGDDVRDAVAAELERGDRCGVGPLSKGEYRDDAVAILSIVREHVRGRGLLAEPRVNPSEAKDDLERGGYIEAPKRLLPRSVSAASFDPYMLAMSAKTINAGVIHEVVVKAWVVLWLLERAGLLAEGEESREP